MAAVVGRGALETQTEISLDSISIFRIKDGIIDHEDMLKSKGSLWNSPVRIGRSLFGVLYAKKEALKPPAWLKYFHPTVDFSDLKLRTGGSAAVLLAHRGRTFYGIAFGYGRLLLKEEAIEPRFGLRVTLNAIEPSKIRSIDHRRLEGIARHTREQLSRSSGIRDFGLDIERDVLAAATGSPSDSSLGNLLAGRDQLTVVGNIPLHALPDHLDRYEMLSKQSTYKDSFPWVDNIAAITDPTVRDDLNKTLAEMLDAGQVEQAWLAPPDILEWGDHAGFAYAPYDPDSATAELELPTWLAFARTKGPITPERLKTDRIRALRAQDEAAITWSVIRCIVAELEYAGHTYVINDGKWYQIDTNFLTTINAFISSLQPTTARLPLFGDADEGAYNARVATASKGQLTLLDKKFPAGSPYGQIETCDLYSATRQLIHVKRYRASHSLSHLFNQGFVSAELLAQDLAFRTAFNQLLPAPFQVAEPKTELQPRMMEVAYAVIVTHGKKQVLPFFSRVSLRNTVRSLARLGFQVSLTYVSSYRPSNQ